LAAWYPGEAGGEAISDILFGAVNPSGRLAMSFPRNEADLVRPRLPNLGAESGADDRIDYTEGVLVGYRWYAAKGTPAAFSFGHGLSYSRFEQTHLEVEGGKTLEVSFDVKNVGARSGADVAQVYLMAAADRPVLRLIGFERVALDPGETRHVSLRADPRLLATYDETRHRWQVAAGRYRVRLGESASDLGLGGDAKIVAQRFTDRALPSQGPAPSRGPIRLRGR
jgi:beta-glucosidase